MKNKINPKKVKNSNKELFLLGTVEILILVFLLFFSFLELIDPIDIGYFPKISFLIFYLRVITLFIHLVLMCLCRSSRKYLISVLALGGVIGFILYGISQVISLSVMFN